METRVADTRAVEDRRHPGNGHVSIEAPCGPQAFPLLYEIVTPGAVSTTTGGIAMTSRRRSSSVAPASGRCKAGVSFAALVRIGARELPCFAGATQRIKGLGRSERFAELAREPGLLSNVSRYCRARQSPIRRRRWGMRAAQEQACWRQGAAHVRRSTRKFAI